MFDITAFHASGFASPVQVCILVPVCVHTCVHLGWLRKEWTCPLQNPPPHTQIDPALELDCDDNRTTKAQWTGHLPRVHFMVHKWHTYTGDTWYTNYTSVKFLKNSQNLSVYKWMKESYSKTEKDLFNNLNKGGNLKVPAIQPENSCLKQQSNIIIYILRIHWKCFILINKRDLQINFL